MKLMIIGATSAIAHETAKHFAADGAAFFLVGRDPEKLAVVQHDLEVRGAARVALHTLDLNDLEQHPALVSAARASELPAAPPRTRGPAKLTQRYRSRPVSVAATPMRNACVDSLIPLLLCPSCA